MFGRWSPSSFSLNTPLEGRESLQKSNTVLSMADNKTSTLVFCMETSPWILIKRQVLCISLPTSKENSYNVDARVMGRQNSTAANMTRTTKHAWEGMQSESWIKRLVGWDFPCRNQKRRRNEVGTDTSGSSTSSQLTRIEQNFSHLWILATQSLFIYLLFRGVEKAKGQLTFQLKSPISSSHRRHENSSGVCGKTWPLSNLRSWEVWSMIWPKQVMSNTVD